EPRRGGGGGRRGAGGQRQRDRASGRARGEVLHRDVERATAGGAGQGQPEDALAEARGLTPAARGLLVKAGLSARAGLAGLFAAALVLSLGCARKKEVSAGGLHVSVPADWEIVEQKSGAEED